MIGYPIRPRAMRRGSLDGNNDLAREPLARAAERGPSMIERTKQIIRGTVDFGVNAAQGAVDAVRTNRWGVQDIVVGVAAVAVVASDRVGYIRSYVREQERVRAAIAADEAAEMRLRLEAAATTVATIYTARVAVATLSRFMRREVFLRAAANNATSLARRAAAANANAAVSGNQLITVTSLTRTLEDNRSSDMLIAAVSDNVPRLVFGPTRADMLLGRARWAAAGAPAVEPESSKPSSSPGVVKQEEGETGPKQVSVFKRTPLFGGRCEWKDRMEDDERAAEGVAQFISVGTNGEADVAYMGGQDFWTRLLNRYYIRSRSYHRASNKFCKRLRVLRELREDMIYTGVGHKRERTALNLAAAEELAKKVVSKAIEDGRIPARDARWFKNGLVETYFVRDDDDTFWTSLAQAPMAVRA
nr:hypothetical protein [Tolivirales sp.]